CVVTSSGPSRRHPAEGRWMIRCKLSKNIRCFSNMRTLPSSASSSDSAISERWSVSSACLTITRWRAIWTANSAICRLASARCAKPDQACAHADGVASMDMFVVPTISFRLLYGFLILQHSRRQLLWLGVTAHPSAQWIAGQLTEAYSWEQAPRYIVRDRDCVYGDAFIRRLRAMGIRDRPIAPRSPWQNGYAERLIGSIRRDCLDHVVVLGDRHLRHLLKSYQKYYNEARTHLSLHKDAPIPRAVQTVGRTLAMPVLGGLHHQYFRA